jgi:hypothetical protein
MRVTTNPALPVATLLFGLLLLPLAAMAQTSAAASSITITNPKFSTPMIACAMGYAYDGSGDCSAPEQNFNASTGFGWTLATPPISGQGGDGLTGPNSLFFPPSFSGLPFTQAVFLQGTNNALSQVISGFSAGAKYTLSFYLGSRFHAAPDDGNQTVEALIDGRVIGTWALSSFTPFELKSASFTVTTAGSHTLEFEGLTTGDHTAFLSDVSISTPPPCTLSDAASYSATTSTLTMKFTIGNNLGGPAIWNAWLTYADPQGTDPDTMQLLFSTLQPTTNPPKTITKSFGLPKEGTVGVLSTLSTAKKGIACSSWVQVMTGTDPLSP